MKKIYILAVLMLLSIVVFGYSQIPQQMSYQGYLTDNAGNPISGNHKLTFTIYDAQSGGNTLWIEEHPSVAITDGVFRIQLGSITALDLDFDMPYWLSIKVENDPELAPRVALSSVGYSFNSMNAESVADNSITSTALQDGAVTLPKLQPDMMVKVFEGTCNNVNSYLVSGLNGNLHKIYRIFFQGTIHTGETMLLVRPNQDDVANNFRSYDLYHGNASLSATWASNGMIVGRTWAVANDAGLESTFFAETGKFRYAIGQGLIMRPTGEMLGQNTYGCWLNTQDNVTSLEFSLTNFSGIATGTFSGTFTIYAVNPR
jgi:hypothetical protein